MWIDHKITKRQLRFLSASSTIAHRYYYVGKSTTQGGSPDLELGGQDIVFNNVAGATMMEPQQDISGMESEKHLGSIAEVCDVSDGGRTDDCRRQKSPVYRDENNGGEDVEVSPASDHRDRKRLISATSYESSLSRPEMLDRECTQTSNALEKNGACGEDRSHRSMHRASMSSKRYTRGKDMIRTTESMERLPHGTAWEFSPGQRSRGQYLQSLRKQGLLGVIKAGSTCSDDLGANKAAIVKLTSLLRAEEEGRKRERRGREEAEKEAKRAYASLEVESKR